MSCFWLLCVRSCFEWMVLAMDCWKTLISSLFYWSSACVAEIGTSGILSGTENRTYHWNFCVPVYHVLCVMIIIMIFFFSALIHTLLTFVQSSVQSWAWYTCDAFYCREYQRQLPEEGVRLTPTAMASPPAKQPAVAMRQMFRDFVTSRTLAVSWKYWLVKPLIFPYQR